MGLHIDGDHATAWNRFPGKGTVEDPKVIEGFELREKATTYYFVGAPDTFYDPIVIENVDLYFTIKNCVIYSHSVSSGGFLVKNVSHCVIDNCVFAPSSGIYIEYATVTNNTFYQSVVVIKNCSFHDNWFAGEHGGYMKIVGEETKMYRNNFFFDIEPIREDISVIADKQVFLNASDVGNYWSTFTSPDNNTDGFVDIPVALKTSNYDGAWAGFSSADYLPSVKPFPLQEKKCPPEKNVFLNPLVTLGLSLIIGVSIFTIVLVISRRLQKWFELI
ncbi:MAG: right-handed parallel beta-helix repeat-containing protein [Thermoplasmata archaeon]